MDAFRLKRSIIHGLRAARHGLQRVVRQRPLQRLCLVLPRVHPDVALLIGGQNLVSGRLAER